MKLTRRRFLQITGEGLAGAGIAGIGIGSLFIGRILRDELESKEHGLADITYELRALKPISVEANAPTLEQVYKMFDPSLESYLRSIQILKSRFADTAYAHTSRELVSNQDITYVGVSPDWDNKAVDSKFWKIYSKPPYDMRPEDPVFSDDFKLDLLTHEFFHMIEDNLRLNVGNFFQEVKEWYQNEDSGVPSSDGIYYGKFNGTNRIKYLLWHNLYKQQDDSEDATNSKWKEMTYNNRYKNSLYGTEEFAYTGENILLPNESWRRRDRLLELSEDIVNFHKGIINPNILGLKVLSQAHL